MNKQILQQYLEKQSKNYFDGTPAIPDEVFDRLAEIANFDQVGSKQGDSKHLYQLLSLEKFYPADDDKPNRVFKSAIETVKLDGACISALYVEGKLVRVLTRGDGITGKDITDKFTDGRLIPLTIDDVFRPYQVVLEVVAPTSIVNARNYASGALNLKSLDEFKERDLTCVVHGITPSYTGMYLEDMKALQSKNFKVITESEWNQFPQDGVVVRENSDTLFLEWGETNHHPRGAYALKIRREPVRTVLLDVLWQVGKSGKVTPIAILSPVDIEGAIVSRASLHNIAFIEAMKLGIGDTVEVIRSGEIIPYIVGKVES